jgi:hypothetical protein
MTEGSVRPRGAAIWSRIDNLVLLALFIGGLGVALAVGRDFGQSWDEQGTPIYAQRTLDAYLGKPADEYSNLSLYGPAYMALSEIVAKEMAHGLPGWSVIDGRHAAYFLSFLVAVVSVYVIARGYAGTGAAAAAALLLATQPLLFGHAFINPKDTPFLGLFAGAMACGMLVVRQLPPAVTLGPAREFWRNWTSIRARVRVSLGVIVVAGLVLAVELVGARRVVLPGIRQLVIEAYRGEAPALVQGLFARVATDSWKTGLDAYLLKTDRAYGILALWLALGLVLGAAATATSLLVPTWRRHLLGLGAAGIVAGLATAVRVAGPAAGILVSVLMVFRLRRYTGLPLAVYWAALAVTTYFAWPYLWGNPPKAFLDAAEIMGRFPWNSEVLFKGSLIVAGDLPWNYALTQFTLQLTLPALTLGLFGGGVALMGSRRAAWRMEIVVLWAWLVGPFVAAIVQESTLYDGARQLLFALPPLFVMAAVAFEWVFAHVRLPAVRIAVAIFALLPGVIAIVQLHPYEYIYYNELSGGVPGAYRRYELDYWATSYREAMSALAVVAPEGATVGVAGPWESAWPYGRPDMAVLWREEDLKELPDFFIVMTRSNMDQAFWPEAPSVYEVWRGGAMLARVIDLRGEDGS